VASTGLTPVDEAAIDDASAEVAIVQAANLRLGVNVMLELVEMAAARLRGFDAEISEIHHRHKRDAPSGTALALGAAVQRGAGKKTEVVGRHGMGEPRGSQELGYAALRGGEVAGEHTVFFFGDSERLEITHRSTNADIFAAGALQAAQWLLGRAPGRYDMLDVLR
jgi:4-hydroxy-tetrahydrodipicolinate reductase